MSKIAERLAEHFKYDAEVKRMLLATRSGEDYDTLLDLLYEVAKEVDDDMAYSEVYEALCTIGANGLEDIEDYYYEYCTADIYTHDLLEWMGRTLKNVAWVDEAVSEGGQGSVTAAIATGQARAKEYVWRAVIGLVQKLEEEA